MTFKTDWQDGEYFTCAQYNRIRQNIEDLRTLSLEVYPSYTILGTTVRHESSRDHTIINASFFNNIEKNLETIANNTFKYASFPEIKTLYTEGAVWDAEDLNRIEGICLKLEWLFRSQIANRPKLSMTLGGAKL